MSFAFCVFLSLRFIFVSFLATGEKAGLNPVKEDEFWDYQEQVDLEAFTANTLYEKLASQSHTITQNLARQKEEAKALYQKVLFANFYILLGYDRVQLPWSCVLMIVYILTVTDWWHCDQLQTRL